MIKLSTLILENNQVYLSNLRKQQRQLSDKIYDRESGLKNLSPIELKNIYAQIQDLNDKIKKISTEDEHEQEKEKFLRYQRTGYIPDDTYKRYETNGGLSWLGNKNKYPIVLGVEHFNNYTVEFRQNDVNSQYVKTDDSGNIGRDESGNVIMMTKDEIIEKGLPLKETTIVAFINDQPIGHASNEFGTVGVWVEKRYQGLGIGTALMEKHIEQRPDIQSKKYKIGQMTQSGEGMTKAYYDLMVKKHGKNWWYYKK